MKKFKAFTLAEVMIVIVVISIISVITMPVLLKELSMRVNSNRQANIAQKMTRAVENMIVNGDYENITNTEEFVNKLSKYLKIAKRCNANNIDECWSTKKVKTPSGSTYEVKNAKKGSDIHVNSNEDNVGLILVDGASIILSFNPGASTPSAESGFTSSTKNLPIGKNKYKKFAYTSNATNAIDFVMDVNGGTGPNQEPSNNGEYYDIRPFKIALFFFFYCTGFKVNGACVVDLGTSYDSINCTYEENLQYCSPMKNSSFSIDYWAGAKKACMDLGMKMPSAQELIALFKSDSEILTDLNRDSYFSTNINMAYAGDPTYKACYFDGGCKPSTAWRQERNINNHVLCIEK